VVGPICGGQVSFFATLSGPGSQTGDVDYRFDPVGARFRVDINGFAPGAYTVTAASAVVGQITVDNSGRGSLRYDTEDGTWPMSFPTLSIGDLVDVSGLAAGNLQTAALTFATSFQDGDIHLRADSPCIDAFAGADGMDFLDIDGQPRKSGSAVDIGADEFSVTGDGDGDGDFDLHDLVSLQACLGLSAEGLPNVCLVFDANTDGLVDVTDWFTLASVVSGPR